MQQSFEPMIQTFEVGELARECESDDATILRFIREAELNDIRPTLGDSLYMAIKSAPEEFVTLLNGGTFEGCGAVERSFVGVKTALAYYVWGRLMKASPYKLTRFGVVVKNDDYSHQPDWKERQVAYNDAFSIADRYMKDCLDYISSTPDLAQYMNCCDGSEVRSRRNFTKIIGR